jgi:hypothetical protein
MALNKGDCPELPEGIASGKPILFNRCCVESNLKTKTIFAEDLAFSCSLEQELEQKSMAAAKIATDSCFMLKAVIMEY